MFVVAVIFALTMCTHITADVNIYVLSQVQTYIIGMALFCILRIYMLVSNKISEVYAPITNVESRTVPEFKTPESKTCHSKLQNKLQNKPAAETKPAAENKPAAGKKIHNFECDGIEAQKSDSGHYMPSEHQCISSDKEKSETNVPASPKSATKIRYVFYPGQYVMCTSV